jgi:hypothetical protein
MDYEAHNGYIYIRQISPDGYCVHKTMFFILNCCIECFKNTVKRV